MAHYLHLFPLRFSFRPPMISAVELSTLLATLYAAPLQPDKWQVFFDRLCALTNVSSGYMMSVRPQLGSSILAGGGLNFNPESLHLYNLHYHSKDPYLKPGMANRRIGVIHGDELVSRPHLLRSELYNEVLLQNQLAYMTLISCDCSTEEGNLFPLWSSPKQGPMDADSVQLLQTLIPHMQTALRLRTQIAALTTSSFFSEMALEVLSSAALLVSSTGHVQHSNKLATSFLQRADGLRLNNNRLTTVDPREDTQLQSLISGAAEKERRNSHLAPGGAMRVSCQGAQQPLQITVVPTPDSLKEIGGVPCALIFIHDLSSTPKSRATYMRQLYALTPTESRLADLLLEGEEVCRAAEHLNITAGTARFHLKRIFAKTRTGRQTELMRLMLSLPKAP